MKGAPPPTSPLSLDRFLAMPSEKLWETRDGISRFLELLDHVAALQPVQVPAPAPPGTVLDARAYGGLVDLVCESAREAHAKEPLRALERQALLRILEDAVGDVGTAGAYAILAHTSDAHALGALRAVLHDHDFHILSGQTTLQAMARVALGFDVLERLGPGVRVDSAPSKRGRA